MNIQTSARTGIPLPDSLLAELTHRCPLACPYCSNPMELKPQSGELTTEMWISVFEQAAALGVLHLHLSGGEPASRRDLEELTQGAAKSRTLHQPYYFRHWPHRKADGRIGAGRARPCAIVAAGRGRRSCPTASPATRAGFERKLAVASWVTRRNMPLTVNAVCHRQNYDRLDDMIALAVRLGARRLEVATVQFHGWAAANRSQLMPSRGQAKIAGDTVRAARERLKGVLVIDYVPADYHAAYPKACMGGWGRTGLNVDPTGRVLPCHAAETIKHLHFDNVRDRPLADIWFEGDAFNAYRGFDWMSEPCRTCERRELDFGGCRCQAMALAGDAAATDPVCQKSPLHGLVSQAAAFNPDEADTPFVYRGR